jgi:16S rRNA processing protein RimM
MDIENCYKIGYVIKPHGLKGGVTVSLDADIPNDFSSLETVFLQEAHSLVPYFIESVSLKGNPSLTPQRSPLTMTARFIGL